MANTNLVKEKYKLDIIKYRYLFLGITAVLLIPCIIAIIYLMSTQKNHAPLKLGIDFTGGTILQYAVDKKIATSEIGSIRAALVEKNVKNPVNALIVALKTLINNESTAKMKKFAFIRVIPIP